MNYTNLRTLVLNSSYQPINLMPLSLIPVNGAIVRVFNETCRSVYDYQIRIGTANKSKEIYWPSVIARNSSNYIFREKVLITNQTLYYRDMGKCAYCQRPMQIHEVTYDHVIPSSKGGANDWSNIVCACEDCNAEKGEKLPKGEWAPKTKPYTPTYWNIVENRKRFPLVIYDARWLEFLPTWHADVVIKEPTEYGKDHGHDELECKRLFERPAL